jgi:ComF family protein
MDTPVNQTCLAEVDGAGSRHPDESRWRLWHWLRLDPARLLWPTRCLVCDAPGIDGMDLCAGCAAALPWNRSACLCCAIPLPASAGSLVCGPCLRREAAKAHRQQRAPLGEVRAAFVYAAPMDQLLPRFKFHRDLAAGALLSQLMAAAFRTAPRPQALVPVPLHRSRLRRRGYDQALELARPLAQVLEVPLRHDLLRRVRPTAPQSELDAAARRRNLRGAFAVAEDTTLPAHVALVDDVMTTGATLHAAATALSMAGVERIDAWICARVP